LVKPDEYTQYYFPIILTGKEIYIDNSYYTESNTPVRIGFDITNSIVENRLNEMTKHFFEREEYKPTNLKRYIYRDMKEIPEELINKLVETNIKYSNDDYGNQKKIYFNINIRQSDSINIMDNLTVKDIYKTNFEFDENKRYLVRIKIKHVCYDNSYGYGFKYTLDCPIQEINPSDLNQQIIIEDYNKNNNK
jgi:hypothetical protein